MNTTTTFNSSNDRYIGRTSEGARVYISMELKHKPTGHTTTGEVIEKQTTDHRTITEYTELTVSGLEVPKYCRNAYSAVQIDMHLSAADITDPAIPADMVRDIFRLWKQHHYGSARLVEEMPEADKQRAREIIAHLRNQPEYTGN